MPRGACTSQMGWLGSSLWRSCATYATCSGVDFLALCEFPQPGSSAPFHRPIPGESLKAAMTFFSFASFLVSLGSKLDRSQPSHGQQRSPPAAAADCIAFSFSIAWSFQAGPPERMNITPQSANSA